jgi:hypothetical protein
MTDEEKKEAQERKWARCKLADCPYLKTVTKKVKDEDRQIMVCDNESRMLARVYLDAQQFRIGSTARMALLSKPTTEFEDIKLEMETLEKHVVKIFKERTKDHKLWQFAEHVKGLGDVGVLTCLGYLCPYIADTAGKAKAYLGLTPNQGLKKGLNHKLHYEAKGRFYGVVLHGLILAKDPFYYNYYLQKKAYYAQVPMYAQEIKDNLAKTKSKISKGTAHVDNMAKRATLSLLVSHVTQIMRENEGLDVSAFESHHNYIPPP